MSKIYKILIANRGEIVSRIIWTARRMGIATVAVYSEADRHKAYLQEADQIYPIGPAVAKESYLNIPRLIAAAQGTGANAIHPGYGFLSENVEFAKACADAGIVFIGPNVAAIDAMGSKSRAKAIMEAAGVPLLPGYHGADQTETRLAAEAARVGFPVLIKAAAGGGGKGMRRVDAAAEFGEALAAVKREALSAFGDATVLLERYVTQPRHVEVQIFGDPFGQVVHLFERDCSIQRRHQKVVEEAPAPHLTEAQRQALGAAAVAAGRAVGYSNAGTVEFLMEPDGRFYFMEMNTRLQVEHPVTELITGLDLVEWQIRIAEGEALPLRQDEIRYRGHAIEVRLYAEDPARGFLPATGTIRHLAWPAAAPDLRIDGGIAKGDEITPFYDPMLAKLIGFGKDRGAAAARLSQALKDLQLLGVTHNGAFLRHILDHPEFRSAHLDTGFIDRHQEELLAPRHSFEEVLCLATLALLRSWWGERSSFPATSDPYSPWNDRSGWRLYSRATETISFRLGETETAVQVGYGAKGGEVTLTLQGRAYACRIVKEAGPSFTAGIAGRRFDVSALRSDDRLLLTFEGENYVLTYRDPARAEGAQASAGGKITAPIPGRIAELFLAAGAKVEKGDRLLILEAMKMEHALRAPFDGTITQIHFAKGDLVEEGVELLHLVPIAEAGR